MYVRGSKIAPHRKPVSLRFVDSFRGNLILDCFQIAFFFWIAFKVFPENGNQQQLISEWMLLIKARSHAPDDCIHLSGNDMIREFEFLKAIGIVCKLTAQYHYYTVNIGEEISVEVKINSLGKVRLNELVNFLFVRV